MDIDEIKTTLKKLRKLRREANQDSSKESAWRQYEQEVFEKFMLDHNLIVAWIPSMLDYALFCNEE